MSLKRGNYVAKNSTGTTVLKGLATCTNDVVSNRVSDISEISQHMDAANVIRTFTKDMSIYEMVLRLVLGVGSAFSDQATALAAVATLSKFDTIVTASFVDSDFNWATNKYGVIWDIGKVLAQGEIYTLDITARRFASISESGGTVTETPLDFTGGWKQI